MFLHKTHYIRSDRRNVRCSHSILLLLAHENRHFPRPRIGISAPYKTLSSIRAPRTSSSVRRHRHRGVSREPETVPASIHAPRMPLFFHTHMQLHVNKQRTRAPVSSDESPDSKRFASSEPPHRCGLSGNNRAHIRYL